jgi:hypothetical protein
MCWLLVQSNLGDYAKILWFQTYVFVYATFAEAWRRTRSKDCLQQCSAILGSRCWLEREVFENVIDYAIPRRLVRAAEYYAGDHITDTMLI